MCSRCGCAPVRSHTHTQYRQAYATWRDVQPVDTPQLYLYSTVDAIIPVGDVESHIAAQRKRGVPITAVDFGDSAHCEHYKQYPDKYVALLQEFVDRHVRYT